MARVFILGTYLPKFQASARLTAASYRTEQIISPIVEAGHEVRLCASTFFSNHGNRRHSRLRRDDPLEYYEMNFFRADQITQLKRHVDQFKPDCIIGISQRPAQIAVSLEQGLPVWCDLYGGVMSEAQARASVYRDNSCVNHFWAMERPVLERGDKFSTCSRFQEHFLTGELTVLGRLGRETFGYQFAHSIPPGISGTPSSAPRRRLLRGKMVDIDDYVILWAGGYNTWTDVGTLFRALEKVFQHNPKAKFVSFGGCIDGHDDVTYKRFCSLIERSRFKSRYILLGWKPRGDVLCAYAESDIGLNIDKYHYELVFGTRTRLVEMIAYGLPVITTVGCELSYDIRDHGLGLTFEIGDPVGLADALLQYGKDPEAGRRHYAIAALQHFRDHYTYEKTCKPLLEWLKKPRRSPDADVNKRPALVVDAASHQAAHAPDHGLFTLAVDRLTRNDDEAAKHLLLALITVCPAHLMAHYHLGSLLSRQNDLRGALKVLLRAKAIAQRRTGEAEKAILGGLSFHLGECRFKMGQTHLAAKDFKRCLDAIPGHRKASAYLKKLARTKEE
ncbi:MAG: glycosyltransferase family 4 protein [Candidatus Coatesbacteria bacterium]|nr:glycosyltransferase family 4 protein [Candidatus Coatesbacteria bacterium]